MVSGIYMMPTTCLEKLVVHLAYIEVSSYLIGLVHFSPLQVWSASLTVPHKSNTLKAELILALPLIDNPFLH